MSGVGMIQDKIQDKAAMDDVTYFVQYFKVLKYKQFERSDVIWRKECVSHFQRKRDCPIDF